MDEVELDGFCDGRELDEFGMNSEVAFVKCGFERNIFCK